MHPGDLIGDRFVVERRAGMGGMAEVFHALDRESGQPVAIKVLLQRRGPEHTRFEREAQVLADLRHPAIVRYIAHGLTDCGERWLAMEWLEGEDLAQRIGRSRLAVGECIRLGIRAAEGLGVAHTRGVIHRDLKPGNLFLVGHDVERAKLLDFGIARLDATTQLTQAGIVLGTPGYMAPEQARGESTLTPRVDVFSLGCVLFECLIGTPAFSGDHVMAVLAKILFAEAPRIRELRPEVPRGLDELLARMLAKQPERRPRDGAEAAAALTACGAALHEPTRDRPLALSLTGDERRVLSVVVIAREAGFVDATTDVAGATDDIDTFDTRELRGVLAHRGRFELLADGSIIVTIDAGHVATDQAALAARCALSVRALAPDRPIALATGRGELADRLPVGDVIDRAAAMLAARKARSDGASLPIAIDDVTAGLLDGRFEVRAGEAGFELVAACDLVDSTRTLLGKPTACVGRERELALLEGLLAQCIEEEVAQAVLVTAPTGIGKSRLAHEFVRALLQREPSIAVWRCRGDSLRAGSAFDLLGQLVRDACAIREGDPMDVRQDRLRARVARNVPVADRQRVVEFLAEIVQARLPDDTSLPLRAARADVQLMAEQMRLAWEDFVRAETAAQPVLLVLEDLQWGDRPTVQFIDAALRTLDRRPLMVLALARPEVDEAFPRLWAGRDVQQLRLKGLTHRACERLIRQVLGAEVSPATIERLVAQADGHVFFLEELIRAVVERRGETLPETVLAMVQARLAGLSASVRRVMRAASVFGEACWPGGVAALLGGEGEATDAADAIAELVREEVLVASPQSRLPGEPELAFRHALLREGAYAMLTAADRELGHRLAAQWLERAGEHDPIVLAEHCERGRDGARAGAFYRQAAEQALRGNDTASAVAHGRRGLVYAGSDEERVALHVTLCEAFGWRSELGDAARHAERALVLAAPGSAPWARAVWARLWDTLRLDDFAGFMTTLALVREVTPTREATASIAWAIATGMFILDIGGQFALAEVNLLRVHAIVEPVATVDPIARAVMCLCHVHREACTHEDPWAGMQWSHAAIAGFREANNRRHAALAQVYLGLNLWQLGAHADAERELRDTMTVDHGASTSMQQLYLVNVLLDRGAVVEAHCEATRAVEFWQHNPALPADMGRARLALASVLLHHRELAAAADEARAAADLLARAPLERAAATATLAAVLLAGGDVGAALTTARAAVAEHTELGSFGLKGNLALLVHAEALHAAGDRPAALAAITAARARVRVNAAKVADEALRRSFLTAVPEHARILALADAWST